MDARATGFIDEGLAGWRRPRRDAPLSDVYRSIVVPRHGSEARKLAAFLGPGYLVAVGYMDPGNWATSIAGGSRFGYTLLVVALVSNIMAIVLQSLCARLAMTKCAIVRADFRPRTTRRIRMTRAIRPHRAAPRAGMLDRRSIHPQVVRYRNLFGAT